MKLSKKILALLVVLCISIGAAASASPISFTDSDLGSLLNKVTSVTALGTGGSYAKIQLSGSLGKDNMVDSEAMTALLQKSKLHISFDYQITETGKSGLRVEIRGGLSDKVKDAVNPYWSGWQYDSSASVTPNVTHHFEAVLNSPQLCVDQSGNSANYYLFVGNVGSTLTLTNIKIREWNTSGTNLTFFASNVEETADASDKPEGYSGKIYHLTTAALTKQAVRIVNENTHIFKSGTQYGIEFWYKTNAANANYFALVNKSSSEYAKIGEIDSTNVWTKANFTFTPEADMTGTFANFQKNNADSADLYFTEWVIIPKAPVSNTVVADNSEIMMTNDANVVLSGYFTPPESLDFVKGINTVTVVKTAASTDFSGYTTASYTPSGIDSFENEGAYTAAVTDIWGAERSVCVKFLKYSDETRKLTVRKAKWAEIFNSSDGITIGANTYNKIDNFPSLKTYLNSDCAMFKVEFDMAIANPVNDGTVTEITLRTGSDGGHTVYKVNNSELTTTAKHFSYIDNQSISNRYNVSNNKVNDRYSSNQWWFFARNRCTAQNVNISNIKIYALTPDDSGDIMLGTASLTNRSADAAKVMGGTLLFAEYDNADNSLATVKREIFELKDTVYAIEGGGELALSNGVSADSIGYANIIISSRADANYKLFWLDGAAIAPLAEAATAE